MATIDSIELKDATGDDLEVTIRGNAEKVIDALVHGLSRESLEQLRDAMTDELAKRAVAKGSDK